MLHFIVFLLSQLRTILDLFTLNSILSNISFQFLENE